QPNLKTINKEIQALSSAIQQGLVLAAHDISEGGVAAALAEMSFKRSIGFKVEIPGELSLEKLLFSETGGFVLEVNKQQSAAINALFTKFQVPFQIIGTT